MKLLYIMGVLGEDEGMTGARTLLNPLLLILVISSCISAIGGGPGDQGFQRNHTDTLIREETELLRIPTVGEHQLHVLSPSIVELLLVNTELPGKRPVEWNFVDENGATHLPVPSRFQVTANGRNITVSQVGFKRRVLYAPLKVRDLRIGNWLYLELASPVPEGAELAVRDPDGLLWKPDVSFIAKADPLRLSAVIHVNQVGYATGAPKVAMVGYYLGSL